MPGNFGEKILYFDVETTGIDKPPYLPGTHGIWSIGAVYEKDGKIVDCFYDEVAPFPEDRMDPVAVAMSGMTPEQLLALKPQYETFQNLTRFMGRHVNKFDQEDKFTMVAYNSQFDDGMAREWFKKLHNGQHGYYGSWFWGYKVCLYNRVQYLLGEGHFKTLPKIKQDIVADHFGISYRAHHSFEDAKVTRRLHHILRRYPEMSTMDETGMDITPEVLLARHPPPVVVAIP